MRLMLLALAILTTIGCTNSAQEESLKLQRYEGAKKQLKTVELAIDRYKSLESSLKAGPIEKREQAEGGYEFLKQEQERLQHIVNENRP